jgi:hypothetical protein
MNVISFDSKKAKEEADVIESRKESLLNLIDSMKEMVEDGKIKEIAATSVDSEGNIRIHVFALDAVGAVGMFEVGKAVMIDQGL